MSPTSGRTSPSSPKISSSWSPMLVQHCLDACEGGQVAVLFFMPAAPNAMGVSWVMLDERAAAGGRVDEDEEDDDDVVLVVVAVV